MGKQPQQPNPQPRPIKEPERRDLPKRLPDIIPLPERESPGRQENPEIERGWRPPKR